MEAFGQVPRFLSHILCVSVAGDIALFFSASKLFVYSIITPRFDCIYQYSTQIPSPFDFPVGKPHYRMDRLSSNPNLPIPKDTFLYSFLLPVLDNTYIPQTPREHLAAMSWQCSQLLSLLLSADTSRYRRGRKYFKDTRHVNIVCCLERIIFCNTLHSKGLNLLLLNKYEITLLFRIGSKLKS